MCNTWNPFVVWKEGITLIGMARRIACLLEVQAQAFPCGSGEEERLCMEFPVKVYVNAAVVRKIEV